MAGRRVLVGTKWVVTAAFVASCLLSTAAYDDSFSDFCQCESFCQNTQYCERTSDGSLALRNYNWQMGALESKKSYVYGTFSVRAKLPAGYTGGIISTFYLTSSPHCDYRAPHDEIDFEFLGNTSAQNMIIHTNLLSEGMSKLEQYAFPFDPSADFHDYSIIWTHGAVAWLIDGVPIRLTTKKKGQPFPKLPMSFHASMWNAHWMALQPKYDNGPLTTTFSHFNFTGCDSSQPLDFTTCLKSRDPGLPWMRPLSNTNMAAMTNFQNQHTLARYPWKPV